MANAPEPVVTPSVFYRDPMAALKWLESAFGFEPSLLVTDDAGKVGHAEMTFRGAPIGVGGEWEGPTLIGGAALRSPASIGGVGTQFIRIALDGDLDAHCERARGAGANITQEPANQFYGARTYRALDPEGHVWTFHQPTEALTVTEMEKGSGLTIRTSLPEAVR